MYKYRTHRITIAGIISLFLILLMYSCISDFNTTLPASSYEILVVEGDIIEDTTVTFYLSKTFALDAPADVQKQSRNINAKLTITNSDGYQSEPATHLGDGAYQLKIDKLDSNTFYGIRIEYEGDIYCSTLSKPVKTAEIDSVSWIQPEEKGDLALRVSTHGDKSVSGYYLWNYEEIWETMAYYQTTLFLNPGDMTFYDQTPAPFFYCWKQNRTNSILVTSSEALTENRIINRNLYKVNAGDDRFSELYCVTVTQRPLSKTGYEYYQNKLKLNEEMGGLFTPQPAQVDGNIICQTNPANKVIGYVEVMQNVAVKRIFIHRNEISRPFNYNTDCYVLSDSEIDSILSSQKFSPTVQNINHLYYSGYRPSGYRNDSSKYKAAWTQGRCTDCVLSGGSKKKPDFWPNDHK